MTQPHVHEPFRCPAHVSGCGCPDLATSMCNPYHVAGHCPDDIEAMPQVAPAAKSESATSGA